MHALQVHMAAKVINYYCLRGLMIRTRATCRDGKLNHCTCKSLQAWYQ